MYNPKLNFGLIACPRGVKLFVEYSDRLVYECEYRSSRSGRGLEAMKWIIVAVLLIVAIVGNFLYRDIMLAVRALAVVILIAAAGGVALLTTKGKATVALLAKREPKFVK